MTIYSFTRKALLGLTISFTVLGIAACGTTSTPIAEVPAIVESAAPTATTENIEPADDLIT